MTARVHVSTPAEGVTQILLDSGERNFMTWELNGVVERALIEAREGGARVVIIGSAVDGFFISHGHLGDNVLTFTGGRPSGEPMAGIRVMRELDTGPMVSIAAIDGQAWGGGAELAWACDLRVATTRATFAQPEVNLGVTPGAGGAVRLARLAGEATALRMVLDARPIGAEEALRLGLVHRVVKAGTGVDAAVEWATWLASRPAGALSNAKRAIKGARDLPLLDGLKAELQLYIEGFSQADNLARARAAQECYDRGGDSWEAFGVPRDSARR